VAANRNVRARRTHLVYPRTMRRLLPFLALALLLSAPPIRGQERPEAATLVEEAWLLLPPYDGSHRSFLKEEERRDTSAGAHLFAAAVELDPSNLRALWSLGHAHTLLGEDRRNRGLERESREHYGKAIEALSRALDIEPDDPWSAYARGVANTTLGFHEEALADLSHAVDLCEASAGDDEAGGAGSLPWLRFKALEWRSEVLMRLHEGERAREELAAFHREFSNNEWPLFIAEAESFLRERDLAGARGAYERAIAAFPNDHQAYALLGYVEGLVGDRAEATRRLGEALERELEPGMYTRLWHWILATDDVRDSAHADLVEFLSSPPSKLGAWDVLLGRFAAGEGEVADFGAAARAERERRIAAAEPTDDLLCEAWFYVGWRREHDAEAATDEAAREALLRAALEAHRTALAYRPERWKWEWAYARLRFADLAETLGLEAQPGFSIQDGALTGGETGTLLRAAWSVPRSEEPRSELGREPRPGDLLSVLVRREGRLVPLVLLVDGR